MVTRKKPPRLAVPHGYEKKNLLALLKKEKPDALLKYLSRAIDSMELKQRRSVFGSLIEAHRPKVLDADSLWKRVQKFDKESRSGAYYAPFDVNSKNWMDVPEETEEWCDLMKEFIEEATRVSNAGEHDLAVKSFDVLFELIEDMSDEIVFADELGSWMIGVKDEIWFRAYLKSLAVTCDPADYATRAIRILKHDGVQSFAGKAYSSAMRAASKEQKKVLTAEIKKQKIRTKRERR